MRRTPQEEIFYISMACSLDVASYFCGPQDERRNLALTEYIQLIITAVVSIVSSALASSGLWAFLQVKMQKKDKKEAENSALNRMVRGLGHEKIVERGTFYINRKYITAGEYEDFCKYLYDPYRDMGGDGSAERIMNEVKKLPLHPNEEN